MPWPARMAATPGEFVDRVNDACEKPGDVLIGVHHAAFHHENDPTDRRDVLQRVAFRRHEIRLEAQGQALRWARPAVVRPPSDGLANSVERK
jgi:hypothetical protein